MNILPDGVSQLRVIKIDARQPRVVYQEMRTWLKENGSAWPTKENIQAVFLIRSVTFMYDEDATAFKLKFKI